MARWRSKYKQAIRNARARGIGWEFTYVSWSMVWTKSGHWEERGNKPENYVMARFGDKGSYSPSNVEIITWYQNAKNIRLSEEEKDHLRKINLGNKHCLGKKNALGYRHTKEAKASMSKSRMGHTYNLGRIASEETKRRMSITHKLRCQDPKVKIQRSISQSKRRQRERDQQHV